MKPFADRMRDGILLGCCIGFLVLISSLLLLRPRFGQSHRAPIAAAQTQLAIFKTALDAFESDNSFYPAGLQALVQQPSGATNWHGPYLDGIRKDPCDRDYVYNYPAKQKDSGSAFDLRSLGPPDQNSPVVWSPGLTHPMSESVQTKGLSR